jgi:hypothetical protein
MDGDDVGDGYTARHWGTNGEKGFTRLASGERGFCQLDNSAQGGSCRTAKSTPGEVGLLLAPFGVQVFPPPIVFSASVEVETCTVKSAIARRFDWLFEGVIRLVGCWDVLVFLLELTQVIHFGAWKVH